ncbi:hypothetical protein DMENIID0001_109240 [Sergentomyia squamirostris]
MFKILVVFALVAVVYGFPEDIREGVKIKEDVIKNVPMKDVLLTKEEDVKKDLKDSSTFAFAYYRPYIYSPYSLPVRSYHHPAAYIYPTYRYWI